MPYLAPVDDTYAEAFRSIYAEILITARDRYWVDKAVDWPCLVFKLLCYPMINSASS